MDGSTDSRVKAHRVSTGPNKMIPEGREALIVLMGMTGSGKSSFFNLISGSNAKVGKGLKSCTDNIQLSAPFDLDGYRVTLVDTPGFDDTDKTNIETLRLISAYLSASFKGGKKLTGLIYMHRISDVRMDGISARSFNMFRNLCGTDTLKNVVVVTNCWGDVDLKVGIAREKELMAEDIFFKPVLHAGGHMMRHDRSTKSAQSILRRLLHNSPTTLNIQRQLVEEKMTLVETDAGLELIMELKRQEEDHQEEMRVLQGEMQAAIKAKDEVTRQELGQALQDAQAQLKHVRSSASNLAKGLQDIESVFAAMQSSKNGSDLPIGFTGNLHQLRVFISTSVRKRLELSRVTIITQLENIDGSRQSIAGFRARLTEEYNRMSQSISEEIETGDPAGTPLPSPMSPTSNNIKPGSSWQELMLAQNKTLNEKLADAIQSNEQLQVTITDLQGQLKRVETDKASAVAAEAAKTALENKGKTQALAKLKESEERLVAAKKEFSELEGKFNGECAKSSDLAKRVRLLEEEGNQTRERLGVSGTQHQAEVARLKTELQSKVENINRLREECKTSQSKCAELQQQCDRDASNAGAWRMEVERLKSTIISMKTTYESSTTARAEQATHISSLISQLRMLVGNAGEQCDKLQTAYSECTKVDLTNASKISVESKVEVEEGVKVDSTKLVSLTNGQSNTRGKRFPQATR